MTTILILGSMLVPVAVTVVVADGARIAIVVGIVLSAIVTSSASTPPSTAWTISSTLLPLPLPCYARTLRPTTVLFTPEVGPMVSVVRSAGSLPLLSRA